MSKFASRLKELRQNADLSMKQLADHIQTSDASVSNWENGVNEPKAEYIVRLADFFECSADYLLGREDDFGVVAGSRIANLSKARHNNKSEAIETDNLDKIDGFDKQIATDEVIKILSNMDKTSVEFLLKFLQSL